MPSSDSILKDKAALPPGLVDGGAVGIDVGGASSVGASPISGNWLTARGDQLGDDCGDVEKKSTGAGVLASPENIKNGL